MSSKSLVQWLTLPLTFVLGIWVLVLRPDAVLRSIPAFRRQYNESSIAQLLPPHPKTLHEAWLLGELEGRLKGTSKASEVQSILAEAAQVCGRPVSREELQAVGPLTLEMQEGRGIVSRILGIFNFVNVLWALAIIGILCTLLPALAFLGEPLFRFLVYVFTEVIWPIVIALKPVFEAAGYAGAYVLAVEAYRYPPDVYSMLSVWLAVSSSAAFLVLFLYTSSEHAPSSGDHKEAFASLTHLLLACVLVPHAACLRSSLLGFLAVAALCGALGFSVACYGLCWALGFEDGPTMLRAGAACFLLNVTFMGLRAFNVPADILKPFASGVGVICGVVYFLSLLIFSSRFSRCSDEYWVRQLPMCFSLLLFILVGNAYHIRSVANTATTFAVLYCVEKYAEWASSLQWGPAAVCWFVGSFVLYFAAMYLHSHPDIIVAIVEAAQGKDLV
eukprot:EG_transcript_12487